MYVACECTCTWKSRNVATIRRSGSTLIRIICPGYAEEFNFRNILLFEVNCESRTDIERILCSYADHSFFSKLNIVHTPL